MRRKWGKNRKFRLFFQFYTRRYLHNCVCQTPIRSQNYTGSKNPSIRAGFGFGFFEIPIPISQIPGFLIDFSDCDFFPERIPKSQKSKTIPGWNLSGFWGFQAKAIFSFLYQKVVSHFFYFIAVMVFKTTVSISGSFLLKRRCQFNQRLTNQWITNQ